MTREIVLAVAAALVAAYVASVHPLAIFGAFAAVLGFIPYLHVPCTPVPLLLVLSVGVWVALAFLPGVRSSIRAARAVAPRALAALASLGAGHRAVRTRSLLESSPGSPPPLVVSRAVPAPAARATTVRVFVLIAPASASLLGIVLVRIRPLRPAARRLTIAGYEPATTCGGCPVRRASRPDSTGRSSSPTSQDSSWRPACCSPSPTSGGRPASRWSWSSAPGCS